MKDFLVKLREASHLTQAELAEKLGISRPTLTAIEKGERDVTISELKKISEIFDVPVEVMLDDEISAEAKTEYRGFGQKAFQKFHNLVLQCIACGADNDGKITKTKLAKLVYLCDFVCYYKYLQPISGFEYRRLDQGPVAIEFFDLIDEDESIVTENKGNASMVSLLETPEQNILSSEEQAIVEAVCKKWQAKNTQTIVDFTHHQVPWSVCREREVIPYELIHMEEPENVYWR